MAATVTSIFFFFLLYFLCSAQSFTSTDTITFGQPLSGKTTIVSKEGTFELGFFTPGNSQRSYIGIWYKKRPERTVIWVANREKPVFNSSLSELKIVKDGNLAIIYDTNTEIWSSNLKSIALKSTAATLLENGNLVLINNSEPSAILWQSFDHPTDTWLPGAKLGWNSKTKEYMTLVSWKSPDDPAPGYYSYGMDPKGSDQLMQIWNWTEVYWKSGEWNGRYFSSVPEMTRNAVFNYTYFQSEKYLIYSLFDTQIITRLVADISGEGNQWAWLNNSATWTLAWTQPREQCLVYSFCGPFSTCSENSVPLCSCLEGFRPVSKSDWDSKLWGGGCVRNTPLECENTSAYAEMDKFLPMINMQWPSNSDSLMVSLKECEQACLNRCSCSAYAYQTECRIWNGDIRNLKTATASSAAMVVGTVYLRLAASDLNLSTSSKSNNQHHLIAIIVGVAGVVFVLAIVLTLTWRFRREKVVGLFRNDKESSLMIFRYSKLQSLTNNFSERLGGGGFGSVYKGILPGSAPIAVKKLEGHVQGEKQFRAEVSTMGIIQHANLVRLRGFCCEGDKRLLVYDYMPKGSLDSHLCCKSSKVLAWKERYQIAIGTSRGLAYLHEQCRECIIHCDIKPENILLDDDLCPKLADFGMAKLMGRDISRVLTTMRGTVGYLAPEWISGLPITPKADVYSFGMVLLELISGRRNTSQYDDHDDGISFFPLLAAKKIANGEVISLLDEKLEGNADRVELERACRVACWCIQDQEMHRPSMGQVVLILEGMAEVSIPPIPNNLQNLMDD